MNGRELAVTDGEEGTRIVRMNGIVQEFRGFPRMLNRFFCQWIRNGFFQGGSVLKAQKVLHSVSFPSVGRLDPRWYSGQCYPIVPWIIMKRTSPSWSTYRDRISFNWFIAFPRSPQRRRNLVTWTRWSTNAQVLQLQVCSTCNLQPMANAQYFYSFRIILMNVTVTCPPFISAPVKLDLSPTKKLWTKDREIEAFTCLLTTLLSRANDGNASSSMRWPSVTRYQLPERYQFMRISLWDQKQQQQCSARSKRQNGGGQAISDCDWNRKSIRCRSIKLCIYVKVYPLAVGDLLPSGR